MRTSFVAAILPCLDPLLASNRRCWIMFCFVAWNVKSLRSPSVKKAVRAIGAIFGGDLLDLVFRVLSWDKCGIWPSKVRQLEVV